jgi:hypothetical protein
MQFRNRARKDSKETSSKIMRNHATKEIQVSVQGWEISTMPK